MRRRSAVAALLLLGCAGGPRSGELGARGAMWVDGFQHCAEACDPRHPLAEGASAYLWIEDRQIREVARVEDPAIAAIGPAYPVDHFVVSGVAVGQTRVLLERDGVLLDAWSIEVRAIDRVTGPEDAVEVTPTPTPVRLDVWADGERLRGFGAVRYEAPASLTTTPWGVSGRNDSLFRLDTAQVGWERVDVSGSSTGDRSTIRALVGDATAELEILDVAPVIREIVLSPSRRGAEYIVTAGIDYDAPRDVVACCAWSLETADALTLGDETCDTARVTNQVSSPAMGTLTCESHGVARTVTLDVEPAG